MTALSKKLHEHMSLLLCQLSIPDPCPSSNCYAPNPLPHDLPDGMTSFDDECLLLLKAIYRLVQAAIQWA